MTGTELMTRRDRDDLDKLARMREKVAKNRVEHRKAELMADFEQQLASIYAFNDDAVWKEAKETAQRAVELAARRIADRCRELGIPKTFQPTVGIGWSGRGENATVQRRAELRAVARTRLDAMAKEATASIAAASLEIRTEILAGGLETEAARAFVESMPTPEALMPQLDAKSIDAARGEQPRYGLRPSMLTTDD